MGQMTELPQDVIEFLKANAPSAFIGPGDLTVATAAQVWGCSEYRARINLGDLVSEGKVRKEARRGKNGVDTFVYLPIKKGKKE